MRILVTGAAGFIGHWVCRLALERGWDITALVHRSTQRVQDLEPCARFALCAGDICDAAHLEKLVEKRQIEAICHLAVVPPGDDAALAQAVNVEATRALVDLAQKADIQRLVYTSTMSVYDFVSPRYLPVDEEHPTQPQQSYGREKLAGEKAVLVLAERAAILRLAGIYGPDRCSGAVYNFVRGIMGGQPLEIKEDRAVDLLYVEDAAKAVLDALQSKDTCGIYTGGAGQALRLSALALEIGELLGVEPDLRCGPRGTEFYMDISKAGAAWSFAPRPRRTALQSYIDWIVSQERRVHGG